MKTLLALLLLIPSLSWGNIPQECKDIRDGEEAFNFSSEIIQVFKDKDLSKISEMSNIIYGKGNFNHYDLSNLNMTDVFDEDIINDLVSRAEPICERFSYEGYNFGWGIWFEFLGSDYDEDCQMIISPKIIALNEGIVKEEFQISPDEIVIDKDLKVNLDQSFKCDEPILSTIIQEETLEMPLISCVNDRFSDRDVLSGGEISEARWECTASINRQKIDEILIEDKWAFEKYDTSENLNKYFTKN